MAAIELYNTPLFNDPNLVGYYRFEGNSNDSKGTNNGTDTGTAYSNTYGKFNKGVDYNGSAYTALSTYYNYDRGQALSINLWLYLNATGTFQTLFCKQASSSPYNGYNFAVNTSNYLDFSEVNTSGSNILDVEGSTALTTGAWNMVTLTYDGSSSASGIKFYINGVAETTTTLNNSLTASISNSATTYIATRAGSITLNGYMDDLSIFTRVLTATEISNLYKGAWGNASFLLNFL